GEGDGAAGGGGEGNGAGPRPGRPSPPPSSDWRGLPAEPDDRGEQPRAGRSVRARGRFTRNFVVQASAADWAVVFLAGLRRRLGFPALNNASAVVPAVLPGGPSAELPAATGGEGQP